MQVEVTRADLVSAMQTLVAAGARSGPQSARRLPAPAHPLLQPQVQAAMQLLQHCFPLAQGEGNR